MTTQSDTVKARDIPGHSGPIFWKGDADYAAARGAAAWRANKPGRYPEVICHPKDVTDVQAAVRFANEAGLRVGVKSGGHSWVSPHIRDGAMLIDLVGIDGFEIDVEGKTAWTRLSVRGSRLNKAFREKGLFFPGGHNTDVAIGGFTLCGGYGWNGRAFGNGCTNLLAVEMVTADGEVLICDETQNSDLYWAARGAGPGIPGVVTRLKLRLHDFPKTIHRRIYSYGLDDLDELLRWSMEIIPDLPDNVEPIISANSVNPETGEWAPTEARFVAVSFADTDAEAEEALAIFETCPVLDKANNVIRQTDVTMEALYRPSDLVDPEGYRYAADSIWTNASPEEVIPAARPLFSGLPTPYTHVFWQLWGKQPQEDMALSVQADLFVAVYTVWDDPARDEEMMNWAPEKMKAFEPVSVGSQLNDDATLYRKSRYLSEEAMERLDAICAERDPDSRFLSFLDTGDPR